jgi:P-type conjugative transfer protein TrbJ
MHDLLNMIENTMTALHQVSAYAQQVQQYKLHMEQYLNQVRNTVAPVAQVWQAAQGTMNSVLVR